MRKKAPSLSVGRGEKLPVSKGGGLTEKERNRSVNMLWSRLMEKIAS